MKRSAVLLSFILIATCTFADVTLPGIFGDHMVLQRHQPIPVWGWSQPREKITVRFHGQTRTVTAGKDGKWKVVLSPEDAGGPFVLTVKGKNSVIFNDVMVGEVWICSGQSNMEWTLRNTDGADTTIAQANDPAIRHIKIPKSIASMPRQDIAPARWTLSSPETAGDFTAVGYHFARRLRGQVKVAVGLINTSWGGTHSETWTSREAFEDSEEFQAMIAAMPRINLDSMAALSTEATRKHVSSIQGSMTASADAIGEWKLPRFQDAGWPVMQVPGLWENQKLGNFDGVVWMRKTVTLNVQQAGQSCTLELGTIDDADETYLNGVLLGSTNAYNEKRVYKIPAGALQAGDNVIAVKVTDTGGGGGFYGEPGDISLSCGAERIALAGPWSFQVASIAQASSAVGPNSYPTLLYNAMIHPLIPYAIRGAIWYQGESNAGRAYQYRKAFPLMIRDWRKRWGQGDFPFYFVQLATFNAANGNSEKGSAWAELREAQAMTLSLPHTGMAVTTDIGNPKDIHPRNKHDVGQRLAALALRDVYKLDLVAEGPRYKDMEVKGNKAIISFTHTGGGLLVKDKYGYLRGFEVAGDDRKFYYARAFVEGDKVVVHHDAVREPVAVRFGWADDAGDNNLFNAEGLPAAPFRTDTWTGVTEKAKFME